jgi:hypothetical protein
MCLQVRESRLLLSEQLSCRVGIVRRRFLSLNAKEEKEILREVSAVFDRHKLVLEETTKIVEKLNANLYDARLNRAKYGNLPMNR